MEDYPLIFACLAYLVWRAWHTMSLRESPESGFDTLRPQTGLVTAIQVRAVGYTEIFLLCPWVSCAGTFLISTSKSGETHSIPASHRNEHDLQHTYQGCVLYVTCDLIAKGDRDTF